MQDVVEHDASVFELASDGWGVRRGRVELSMKALDLTNEFLSLYHPFRLSMQTGLVGNRKTRQRI